MSCTILLSLLIPVIHFMLRLVKKEMSMETNQNTEIKRPELLTILCILTFIGSGLAASSNLFIYLNHDLLNETIENEGIEFFGSELILGLPKSLFIFSALFYFSSLMGAILMWKLKKIGFHIYSVSQVILLIIPSIYIKSDNFPIFGILLTLLFILLYHKNIKFMQ